MCEPAHSIVQFPDPDEHDDDNYSSPQAGKTSLSLALGGVLKFTTKIGRWLNLSRLGAGHGGAISFANDKLAKQHQLQRRNAPDIIDQVAKQQFYMPASRSVSELSTQFATSYECDWWQRHLHVDGEFTSSLLTPHDKQEALDAAKEYNRRVCDGDIQKFRLFLERSLVATGSPASYYDHFIQTLQGKAKDELENKMRLIAGEKKPMHGVVNNAYYAFRKSLHSCVKAMLGMTRKRSNMIDVFADDDGFWKKGKDSEIVLPQEQRVQIPHLSMT